MAWPVRRDWSPPISERSADTGHSPAAPPSGWALLATLQAHTGPVYGLAFGTDGRLLASGGLDGAARLWEPRRGFSLRILRMDRRYERMDLTGVTGMTAAQRAALLTLGALDH